METATYKTENKKLEHDFVLSYFGKCSKYSPDHFTVMLPLQNVQPFTCVTKMLEGRGEVLAQKTGWLIAAFQITITFV